MKKLTLSQFTSEKDFKVAQRKMRKDVSKMRTERNKRKLSTANTEADLEVLYWEGCGA